MNLAGLVVEPVEDGVDVVRHLLVKGHSHHCWGQGGLNSTNLCQILIFNRPEIIAKLKASFFTALTTSVRSSSSIDLNLLCY
jgi:hypothetical protein